MTPAAPAITHRQLQAGSLSVHVAEAGQGPLVLLLHGFPESWYSWRHQLAALAAAGYHAVAPDQRGYCGTDAPADPAQYTILHLTGDVLALMDALGEQAAVVAGHDWGAPVAWHAALLRPDRIRGVAGLSVPYRPRGATPPVAALRRLAGDGFYMVYFQQPGPADEELGADPAVTFRKLLCSVSAALAPVRPGGGLLGRVALPAALPGWLTEGDLAEFTAQYAGRGFTGPLNWYRNLDRNWELTAAWQHAPITVPSLFLAGADDPVLRFLPPDGIESALPGLTRSVLLPGAGHWVQQERPAQVSAALLEFLAGLG